MKELTVLEQIIMAAIVSLGDEAYGVAIRGKVKSLTGRSLMYGTLYNALDQLLKKGFIQKSDPDTAAPGRGLHGRVYYTASAAGRTALRTAYRLQKSIWAGIRDFIEDGES